MSGKLSFGDQAIAISNVRLELYNLGETHADWNLLADLPEPWARLALSGSFETGSDTTTFRLAYVDAPDAVVVDGRRGGLTNGGRELHLNCVFDGPRARLFGRVTLEWFGFEEGSGDLELVLDVDAAVSRT